jgi:predicted ATPase
MDQDHVLIDGVQRCPDQQLLTDAYQKRQFVLISGPSGSGKSTLAMTLRSQVEMEGGYFLLGKFNQFQSPSPYEAMVLAMTDFIQQLEKRGKLDEMRSHLNASIHFEMNALTNTIPALKALIEDQNQIVPEGGKAMIRFIFAFRTLLQKISSLENPIVVLIDDLQWSDDCSLQLLLSILSDPSSCGICLLTTFHVDIERNSSLPNLLEHLDGKGIKYCHIELEDITGQVANTWIHNSSEHSSANIKMLPSSLLENSNRSVLLILERIRIHQSVLISSQGNNSEFECHETNRDMMQLSLRQILQNRMDRLSDAMKDILITAAFLQSTVLNVELLSRIETNSLAEFLSVALENKMVLLEGGKYVWAHDEIEAAAYFLVDSQKREKTHLSIGRKLWKYLEVEEVKANIFLVLNQYKRAENIITKQDERNAVGLMCLWAGESAIRSSSFQAAKLYLEFGVNLLHQNNSHPDYNLSISILSLAAECAFCQSGKSIKSLAHTLNSISFLILPSKSLTRQKRCLSRFWILYLVYKMEFGCMFFMCVSLPHAEISLTHEGIASQF